MLVTGANSGIGLATVLEVSRLGFRAIGGARTAEKADLVIRAARDAGHEVETVLLDVTDAAACAEVVAPLDLYGLVNNAGYALTGAIEDVSDEEARTLFETMVLAPMRLARVALPGMRRRGEGRIVNVSSIAGRVTAPLGGWYVAAKHALEAVSDALRMEVARDGVHVALVEPGGFRTGIWREVEADVRRREEAGSRNRAAYERFLRVQQLAEPLMGRPEHCARAIGSALGRHPRPRYLVGLDAWALEVTNRVAPTSIRDRAIRTVLGL